MTGVQTCALPIFIEFIRNFEELYHNEYYPDGFDENKQYTPSPLFLHSGKNTVYGSRLGLPSYFNDVYALFYEHHSQKCFRQV